MTVVAYIAPHFQYARHIVLHHVALLQKVHHLGHEFVDICVKSVKEPCLRAVAYQSQQSVNHQFGHCIIARFERAEAFKSRAQTRYARAECPFGIAGGFFTENSPILFGLLHYIRVGQKVEIFPRVLTVGIDIHDQ